MNRNRISSIDFSIPYVILRLRDQHCESKCTSVCRHRSLRIQSVKGMTIVWRIRITLLQAGPLWVFHPGKMSGTLLCSFLPFSYYFYMPCLSPFFLALLLIERPNSLESSNSGNYKLSSSSWIAGIHFSGKHGNGSLCSICSGSRGVKLWTMYIECDHEYQLKTRHEQIWAAFQIHTYSKKQCFRTGSQSFQVVAALHSVIIAYYSVSLKNSPKESEGTYTTQVCPWSNHNEIS